MKKQTLYTVDGSKNKVSWEYVIQMFEEGHFPHDRNADKIVVRGEDNTEYSIRDMCKITGIEILC